MDLGIGVDYVVAMANKVPGYFINHPTMPPRRGEVQGKSAQMLEVEAAA
jgi:hypothetical protein